MIEKPVAVTFVEDFGCLPYLQNMVASPEKTHMTADALLLEAYFYRNKYSYVILCLTLFIGGKWQLTWQIKFLYKSQLEVFETK